MKKNELEEASVYHRGYEDGRAQRDATEWMLDIERRKVVQRLRELTCQSADEAMAIAETFLDTCEGYAYDFLDNPEFLAWQRGHESPWPTQASVVHEVVEALARHIAANHRCKQAT